MWLNIIQVDIGMGEVYGETVKRWKRTRIQALEHHKRVFLERKNMSFSASVAGRYTASTGYGHGGMVWLELMLSV
jgi:hypothetical protein